jgi:hypothetical protein
MIFKFENGTFVEKSWGSLELTLRAFARRAGEKISTSVDYSRPEGCVQVEIALGPKTIEKLNEMATLEDLMSGIGGIETDEDAEETMRFMTNKSATIIEIGTVIRDLPLCYKDAFQFVFQASPSGRSVYCFHFKSFGPGDRQRIINQMSEIGAYLLE